jgi:hypothetical protein
MPKPLDAIELRVAVDSWEARTVATVLEVGAASLLTESPTTPAAPWTS